MRAHWPMAVHMHSCYSSYKLLRKYDARRGVEPRRREVNSVCYCRGRKITGNAVNMNGVLLSGCRMQTCDVRLPWKREDRETCNQCISVVRFVTTVKKRNETCRRRRGTRTVSEERRARAREGMVIIKRKEGRKPSAQSRLHRSI